MRTLVITGGTDGIGRALALRYLRAGDTVVAIGTNPDKQRILAAEAHQNGAGDRLTLIIADLSSTTTTRALAAQLAEQHPVIDALILGAFRYQTTRQQTDEGFEKTFALGVLSRYLLVDGLRPALERSPRPIIVNLCGVGGIKAGAIRWDDLQHTTGYRSFAVTMQGTRANDLLGVAFTAEHPDSPIAYVLHNPLFVDTGLADPFRQPLRAVVKTLAKLFATPVDKAVEPIARRIETPPPAGLSAFRVDHAVNVTGPAFDSDNAVRLMSVLRQLTTAGQ